VKAKFKTYLVPVIISLITYLYYFYPILNSDTVIYSGKDSVRLHYASRLYLYDNLQNNKFPFWTDRMFQGYPIFSDLERGYQNLPNILLIYTFGPYNSYKLLHLICYLIGSLSLFLIIKDRLSNIWYFLPLNLLYFFSFFSILHQQHFNITLTYYLLPFVILLSIYYIQNQKIRYPIYLSLVYYFLITLGSIQLVFIVLCIQFIYVYSFYEVTHLKKLFSIFLFLTLLVSGPSLYTFAQIYRFSERSSSNIAGIGNLDFNLIPQVFYPFSFGIGDFNAGQLSKFYLVHEHSLYICISAVLVCLYLYLGTKSVKHRKFSLSIIFFTLFTNILLIAPFSYFRYWSRSEIGLIFLLVILIAEFLKNDLSKVKISKYLGIILSILLLIIPAFLNPNLVFIFKNSLLENKFIPLVWVFISFLVLFLLFNNLSFKKPILLLVITLDLLFFNSYLNSNLFMNSKDIYYSSIKTSPEIVYEKENELTLLNNNISNTGYSVLQPVYRSQSEIDGLKEALNFSNLYKIYLTFYILYIVALCTIIKYQKKIYEYL